MLDQQNFLYDKIKTLKTEYALLRTEKEANEGQMMKTNDEERSLNNI